MIYEKASVIRKDGIFAYFLINSMEIVVETLYTIYVWVYEFDLFRMKI
jgi:hypothetical protein